MAGLYLETKLRPCFIKGPDGKFDVHALFHCWANYTDPYRRGMHIMGVVEMVDGSIITVEPVTAIKFVDDKHSEYIWPGPDA